MVHEHVLFPTKKCTASVRCRCCRVPAWLDKRRAVKQYDNRVVWVRLPAEYSHCAFFLASACLATPTNEKRLDMVSRRRRTPAASNGQSRKVP